MRTKSRVRGSIGRRASAGKFRLWLSISSFTSAKLQWRRGPPPPFPRAAPAARAHPPPLSLERRRVARRLRELAPCLRELRLVAVELLLDRVQTPHPQRRPAERADGGVGVRPEVPQPLLERLSAH